MAVPSRRLVSNAIATRLATVGNAAGYYGQIGRPLPGAVGTPADPPPKSASDQRVQPYFIYYPDPGGPGPDPDLGDGNEDSTQTHRVTAAAGDIEDLMALVDRLDAVLLRWAPTVTGVVAGVLRPPLGFATSILVDRQYTPNRLYVPLAYQLTVTT